MCGPVSEEEVQRALRVIRAAGREDLLTGQGLRESGEGVRRPQRAAAAGVAAAILACESPSSGSEGGRLSDALKGGKGGAGGSKGKGPAKKQRTEKEVEDVQERTNRVLEALREEERRQKKGLGDQQGGEEGEEELEEGEYAEEEVGLGYGLEDSEEEELAGEGGMQSAVGRGRVLPRANAPVFVIPQPAKERPVVADTAAAVTSGVERPLEDQQAGAGGYKTGELKEEVLKVWGEVLKKKEQQWEDKFEQQWAAHEKEREIMKMVNDDYCAKQQRERAFMRTKSEELCKAMQGRLDQVEELCVGLKRNNDMLEKKLWEEQSEGGGKEKRR